MSESAPKSFAKAPDGPGARLRAWLDWLLQGPEGGAAGGQALPRFFPVFLLLFGVGMILISLIGDQGLIAYYRLQREAQTLHGEVRRLQRHRVGLEQQIEALRNDPAYIEHLARRLLGLVKPDEIVLQLPRPKSTP